MQGCRERMHWNYTEEIPLSRSSATFFGLHTFKVVEGFVHWYLTLKERDKKTSTLCRDHTVSVQSRKYQLVSDKINIKSLRFCGAQRSIEDLC